MDACLGAQSAGIGIAFEGRKRSGLWPGKGWSETHSLQETQYPLPVECHLAVAGKEVLVLDLLPR